MTQFLDTTVRDGSYAFNFNYSCEDILKITRLLKKSGVSYIEIGNGVSVGAEYPDAKHSDCEYIECLQEEMGGQASFGAIYIPEVSDMGILKYCKSMGLKFIRIGEVSNEIDNVLPYIEEIKKIGFQKVFLQVIKTNLVSPQEMGRLAKRAEEYGTDVIYIVDSNGVMTPHEVAAYLYEIKKQSGLKAGFHGHDNCGCALINSYEFIKCGGDFVDVTLAGIGRGPGNTRFEDLLQLMRKEGCHTGIDIHGIWEGSKYIMSRLKESGLCGTDYRIMSYYNFDPNYYGWSLDYACRNALDVQTLIDTIAEKSNFVYSENEFEKLAAQLFRRL